MAEETLDGQWFHRLQAIYEGVPARLVVQGYNQARRDFLSGKVRNPTFSYKVSDDQDHQQKLSSLEALASEIECCSKTEEAVKNLYLEKIREKVTGLELVRTSYLLTEQGDTTQGVAFSEKAKKLYGSVQKEVFAQACGVLAGKLSDIGGTSDLQTIISDGASQPHAITSVILAPSIPADSTLITQAEIKDVLMDALQRQGLSDWQVVRGNKTRTNFAIKAKRKRVVIPNQTAIESRRFDSAITRFTLQGIIAHELTHVLRYENGLNSQLQLLAVGLPGYFAGEEGYALYRQQTVVGMDDYGGLVSYFGSGLIEGVDQNYKPRDFREVFGLLVELYQALYSQESADYERIAFRMCTSLFKGTNGDQPGVYLPLQKCYREGNIATHQALLANPRIKESALLGKFDIANRKHVEVLRQLELL